MLLSYLKVFGNIALIATQQLRLVSSLFAKERSLAFDDFVLGESNAIISFLAKEFGLAGKCNRDEARCFMIADLISDFLQKGKPVRFEQDPEKKKVLEKAFYETDVPNFIGLMVKLLQGNGGEYFVGNEVN